MVRSLLFDLGQHRGNTETALRGISS